MVPDHIKTQEKILSFKDVFEIFSVTTTCILFSGKVHVIVITFG